MKLEGARNMPEMTWEEREKDELVPMPSAELERKLSITRKSVELSVKTAKDVGMTALLKRMKMESGLSARVIASRMGLSDRDSVNKHLWAQRGKGGTGRISWFLRYAAATGCRVWVTFPSAREQWEMTELYRPDMKPGPPVGTKHGIGVVE